MSTKALKADLDMIGKTIKAADGVPDSIKRLFGEMLAWNESLIDHTKDLDERVESAEAALDELIEENGEMISDETAAVFGSAFDHGRLLCEATAALLAGPFAASLDEMSKKRFAQLIENTQKAFALAQSTLIDLAGEEEEVDDGHGDGDDGDGDGDAADDDVEGEEVEGTDG